MGGEEAGLARPRMHPFLCPCIFPLSFLWPSFALSLVLSFVSRLWADLGEGRRGSPNMTSGHRKASRDGTGLRQKREKHVGAPCYHGR